MIPFLNAFTDAYVSELWYTDRFVHVDDSPALTTRYQHATCFHTLIFSQWSHHHKSYWQHVNRWSVGECSAWFFGNMSSPVLSLCERSPLKCPLFWLQRHVSWTYWLLNCLPMKPWMCFPWVTLINWAASHWWRWQTECQLVFVFLF